MDLKTNRQLRQELATVWRLADNYKAATERLQARVDALMLEYCPDEMTPGQIEIWGQHQRKHVPQS